MVRRDAAAVMGLSREFPEWVGCREGLLCPFFVSVMRRAAKGLECTLSVTKLTAMLQPLVEDLGYEFVGLEFSSNPKNAVLVLYIDKPGGVVVEDCEMASREVAALLDVEDPISGHYVLEVSSPGLDRPLFSTQHFARFKGEVVQIVLNAPHEGRRKFKGRILDAGDGKIRIEQDGAEVVLDHGNIAKARLVPDYSSIFAGKA